MAGTLRLSNTGTGNGQSTITTAASGDTTYTLPSGGGTFVTTSSTQALTVAFASGTVSAPSVTFLGDTNTGIYSPAADTIAFTEGGVESLRIDSSGRLLVGTSTARLFFTEYTPAFQLEGTTNSTSSASLVNNSNGPVGPVLFFGKSRATSVGGVTGVSANDELGVIAFNGADGTDITSIGAIIKAEVDGTPGNNDLPSRLVFSTTADGASSPTERMRIDNAGRIAINTTAASQQVLINHSGRDGLAITDSNGSSVNSNILFSNTRAGGTSNYYIFGYANSGNTLIVYSNGNIQNSNNSYAGLSDIKLKENIVGAGSQWSDIKALQVRKYNFKKGQTHTQIGLIAQEVELVSPGLVYETPDRDEDGNDLGTVTKSVNYSVLYMKAVKALQEAMERIEQLEASNAELLARVTALETA